MYYTPYFPSYSHPWRNLMVFPAERVEGWIVMYLQETQASLYQQKYLLSPLLTHNSQVSRGHVPGFLIRLCVIRRKFLQQFHALPVIQKRIAPISFWTCKVPHILYFPKVFGKDSLRMGTIRLLSKWISTCVTYKSFHAGAAWQHLKFIHAHIYHIVTAYTIHLYCTWEKG